MSAVSSEVDCERREVAERLSRIRKSTKIIPINKVEETILEVGDCVEALWRGDEIYYRGKVAALGIEDVTVAFDDGSVDCIRSSHVRKLASDAPRRSRKEIRDDICRLYRDHNPTKLSVVDQLLDRCGCGNEEALLSAIERKYAAPSDPGRAALEAAESAAKEASRFAARAEVFFIYASKRPERINFHIPVGSERELLVALRCKYSTTTFAQKKKQMTSRADVVREIVRSEEEFYYGLRSLEERISAPLRRLNHHQSSVEAVLKLASECDGGICRLSEKLRSDLNVEINHCRENLDNARVGAVFRRFGPFFKMFASYARRFHDTVHARAILSGYCEDDDDYCGLDVSGTLAAPVDRLRSYEALLADLSRHTPSDHQDRSDAEEALTLVREALKHVNQTLARDVAFKRLTQILDASSLSSLLDVPSRNLVKEAKLDQIVFGATGGRVAVVPLRSLALSDRVLLVSLPKTVVLAKKKGTLLYNFPISEISDVEACADGIVAPPASITAASRHSPAKCFYSSDDDDLLFGRDDADCLFRIDTVHAASVILRADTREARDDWIRTLADLRQHHVDRASSVTLQRQPASINKHTSRASLLGKATMSSKAVLEVKSSQVAVAAAAACRRRRRAHSFPEEVEEQAPPASTGVTTSRYIRM